MKVITVKSIEDFQKKLVENEADELAECMFEAIKKGIKKDTKKVAICDVMVEDDGEIFRLYSTREDWPTALSGCMKTFIKNEQYEKCSEIQKISHDYEIKKLLETTNKTDDKPKRSRKPKQSTDTDI